MPLILKVAGLLLVSNLFMTVAWYAHLKHLGNRVWYVAALASWAVALFEYMIQVPANRMGYASLSLGQLKIMQELIALGVFAPFCVLYMGEKLSMNYLWASLCLVGAAFFVFRGL